MSICIVSVAASREQIVECAEGGRCGDAARLHAATTHHGSRRYPCAAERQDRPHGPCPCQLPRKRPNRLDCRRWTISRCVLRKSGAKFWGLSRSTRIRISSSLVVTPCSLPVCSPEWRRCSGGESICRRSSRHAALIAFADLLRSLPPRDFDFRQIVRMGSRHSEKAVFAINNTGIFLTLSHRLSEDLSITALQLFDPLIKRENLPATSRRPPANMSS